ncbi:MULTISPECIES: TetR/AcrR family transcriptional regulator [Streptomyces]|uniref:TetR/AcrR family transcriptional regulator n=1 Tax=Streptomyces TaxID=1883 RepID=UPI0016721B96|nr:MULTISPECIES: TetR/AcrR family transcriptional regulator [Streptomyces]MBK3522319.1 TetR/AcrR family transcriptional regulator [Streptomyces sp. MBT70]GGR70405.1 TetR family transcriptional regulator [Streptomyces eurythermus]
MASRKSRPERRQEPLSRKRIVTAAVELLDTVGEGGLTFRALAERLATGPGAIYWHVTGKTELLLAAIDAVIAPTLAGDDTGKTPQEAIRALALGVFDAIDAHPWVGATLARLPRTPGKSPMLRVFERIGRQVQALRVPEAAQFTAASALLSYILGVAGQNAANTLAARANTDRAAFLDAVAAAWRELDPDQYPFTRDVAGQLREHDDRAEFLAGIDLILAGITAGRADGRTRP